MIDLSIAKSLAIYYGRPLRLARLAEFYKSLLPNGGLYFDIGAHVGHRVWAARRAGARVVAVEPQDACLSVLQWMYGRNRDIEIEPRPIAAVAGDVQFFASKTHPTVASTNRQWIDQVGETTAFHNVQWSDTGETLQATTLDHLIERHGRPDFCKIDIEGSEADALAGLGHAVPIISVERLPQAPQMLDPCLDRLSRLGDYRFNWSIGERPRFAQTAWVDANQLRASLSSESRVCDVFAALPAALHRLTIQTN